LFGMRLTSMKVTQIAQAISPNAEYEVIGIRPGEKLHEQMIGTEDASFTYEYKDYYKILPSIFSWAMDTERINGGVKVTSDFVYSSDKNTKWMSVEELQHWIEKNRNKIGKV
jgi:UDP-N-acetylglucosamine 4,6-dehydratase/5-epimerase